MAGRAGRVGNRSGGVGAVGGAADFVPVLPDRVDLPFVTEAVYDPSGAVTHVAEQIIDIKQFPDRRWSAEWRAWYALSEYVQTGWSQISVDPWTDPTVAAIGTDPTGATSEIEKLVIAARDERADALGEIVAQHEEFASYFFELLTADPATYPATNLLINVASIVGTFTVLHFKYGIEGKYKPRPRPSQVCPALLPPVTVPGHPSYPSGHATEAHLIEAVLNDVFSGGGKEATMRIDLASLAGRISRNREIAGVHYPSDSEAGRKLATDILPYLQSINTYQLNIDKARQEWDD